MLTASVTNNTLIIYSTDSLVGINSGLIYVFDNNIFNSISTQTLSGNLANIELGRSVAVDSGVKIKLFKGGLTTSGGAISTQTITATNLTVYQDPNFPSLIEMIEQGNYNFASYVYSNPALSQNISNNLPTNFNSYLPVASITIKRKAPRGKITINEGYLGPMQVNRFVALSAPKLSTPKGLLVFTRAFMAFNYISYADQIVKQIDFEIYPSQIDSIIKYNLIIYTDDAGRPSATQVAVSSNIVAIASKTIQTIQFSFDNITLNEGTYWMVLTPTADSSYDSDTTMQFYQSSTQNYYTNSVLSSLDGIVYEEISSLGLTMQVTTERGVALPSSDAMYSQLDQPQDITIQYGDTSNLNLYTLVGVATNAHYIQKNILDSSTKVYAIEALVRSNGQGQYQILGDDVNYFTMIANSLTDNIIRFDLKTPTNINNLKLVSLGDYYTKSPLGKVLVSAQDFMGVSTVEVSASRLFPENATLVVNPANNPQNYIANLDFDFGDLGKKLITELSAIGAPVKAIYAVNVNDAVAYLLISDKKVFVYQNGSTTTVLELSSSVITCHSNATSGILIGDSVGSVYNFSQGNIVKLLTLSEIPSSIALQNTRNYIGVSTLSDTGSTLTRKRIYQYSNSTLSHLSWSQQIPEPEINFIYSTGFGLIIGAYDQSNNIGKIYIYANNLLTSYYSTNISPDVAYYSSVTKQLYIGFAGSKILYAKYADSKLGALQDTGVTPSGTIFTQISGTKTNNKIIAITNSSAYLLDETTFATTQLSPPPYADTDQTGLLVEVYNKNLSLSKYPATNVTQSYSNIEFDPLSVGLTSTFNYIAQGYMVYPAAISTSFYLQRPGNTEIIIFSIDGQPVNLTNNVFSQSFEANVPRSFSLALVGAAVTGIGTIALRQGITSFSGIVTSENFVAPKNFDSYIKTSGEYGYFGFSDGSLRKASTNELASNKYEVFARFTDINGIVNGESTYASDTIYNQIQQQQNNQTLPSGRIIEINPAVANKITETVVPPLGADNYVYAGAKTVRSTGVFESDPYFAADLVAWGQIQVLALIPGVSGGAEQGTEVILYVKTGTSLSDLSSGVYSNSYKVSTINNGDDYSTNVASILANIQSLSGKWIQFKLELVSASKNYYPTVKSVLITYTGANQTVFVTKTFDTSVQSTLNPTPKIRRGILTANFVTNGGEVIFGYTTDPQDGNALNYVKIEPNQIFTLAQPSSTIKFGVILYSATSEPCFLDEFAVQLDLGPDDVYFMPPQAAFEIQQYYDETGTLVPRAYEFVNKSIGIVSSYNWTFGTTYPLGIFTYYPPNEDVVVGPAANRQNPVIKFTNSGPFTVGLFITGFVQDNIVFNSELYTKTFIAT